MRAILARLLFEHADVNVIRLWHDWLNPRLSPYSLSPEFKLSLTLRAHQTESHQNSTLPFVLL